ncbi:uncharacterized protein I303_106060 [Kwoniella dejecticola CBS 10117]|uniref:Transmembrane protein n=1 Tax=Kwoniella dejecticola CBS 10117 TaxID=1296121 RepID=A0A1A6A175_9TREE|nr:uncharacterized protein I303_06080 [Kwoniella dejecticola CBS 10117]OBR83797.1 hypothetical protein I303_06080 [Kwoniella dejecticola CBS 10117]
MSSSSSSSAAASAPPISPTQQADNPSSSRLHKAKINLEYLALGSQASVVPASLTTRSALTTARYAIKYIIRRLIRYAKYAAVGAAVAAIGGGLLGTIGSGLAFFAAPGIGVGMGLGVLTAIFKFGWRHRGNHLRGGIWEGWSNMKARAQAGHDGATDEALDAANKEEERRKDENKKTRNDVWMRV